MEVSKSNAGLLNPLFQATQLGGREGGGEGGGELTEVPGLRRAPRDGTWILQMDAAKSGRDPRGVCVCEGRGAALDPHTPTSTLAPPVPATPSEKDQGKKKYGSATLRGQSSLPAPSARHRCPPAKNGDLWPFPFSG